jgi:hypothetical protein
VADIREKVSGIGSMSERTDLNVSKQPIRYIPGMSAMGQTTGQEVLDQQLGAPMAAVELPPIVGFDVPTQFKNEPISSGANYDLTTPGLSSVIPQPVSALSTIEKALQYDTTGVAEFLYNRMNR